MKFRYLFLLFLWGLSACTTQTKFTTLKLDQSWTFNQDGKAEWYPATVPGVVHTDLLNNGLIDDPYWGNNELSTQWIENENWNYRTTFTVESSNLNAQNIEIQFDGLDTYAEVRLNGTLILSSNNMFRGWNVDIKPHLKIGENILDVKFSSPLLVNKTKHDNAPYQLPSGSELIDTKVGSYTRKAAYHFGWDWGPRFVTAGIWRDLKINSWNTGRIDNVNCKTQSINKDKAELVAIINTTSSLDKIEEFVLIINGHEEKLILQPGENQFEYHFTVNQPKLWWTNGLGDPNLYNLEVKLIQEDKVLDVCEQKYGIRTIELINEPDSIGTSFYFKLNGQPVFMKGANYIPQDMFLPRVTDQKYIALIESVKTANMNMLRVWGGGIYENDLFYDLCDENGILVWQDFMFAGSLYPQDTAFLNTVIEEVKYNIVRLRSHPCLAVWCGNNEIEMAWENWGWQNQYNIKGVDSIAAWQNYQHLFHEILPNLVSTYDGTRSYTSTSPLSNWGKIENFDHSSMHYWGVWHGRDRFEKFEEYVGRFMVEYGFQSFPDMVTINQFAADSSLSLDSKIMKNRQKSYIGNGLILDHINQYYDNPETFEDFVVLSQKTQAKAMKMAIEAHVNKQPHCMGTLFWQLNDCWPGPSWSVIDYYGRHKIAYDSVKVAFDETKIDY